MKSRVGLSVLGVVGVLGLVVVGLYLWTHGGKTDSDMRGMASPDAENVVPSGARFSDGLGQPDASTRYPLDEFGAGIARQDVFMRDINDDGHIDRITRTRVENGTDHYYDDYKIELRMGDAWRDITPDGMRTVESADCALQRIQFSFAPVMRIIKISRPWQDSWDTPTMATRTTYRLNDNTLRPGTPMPIKEICNVADLF